MKEIRTYIQICLVVTVLGMLTSCAEGGKHSQSSNQISQTPDILTSSVVFDTIYAANAPKRITRKINIDRSGKLLAAAYSDIVKFDGKTFTKLPKYDSLESFDAFDVVEDRKGNIWVASTKLGVFLHDGNSIRRFTTEEGLAHNRNMCLYEDRAGKIWIGGQGGISCFDGSSFQNYTTKDGLTHDDVNIIMEDKQGKLWIGTRGSLSIHNPSANATAKIFTEVKNTDNSTFNNVWSIIQDKQEQMWIGGQAGLWKYDGSKFTNISTASVSCILEDKQERIWTTNPQGLLTVYHKNIRPDGHTTIQQEFDIGGMPFGLAEDKHGGIWIGTLNGLIRYDGNTFTTFHDG